MMKWIMYVVLAVLTVGSWAAYVKKSHEMDDLGRQITVVQNKGNTDDVPAMQSRYQSLEGEKTFEGILLTFLSAGVVGIFFVVYLLPFFAQRLTHSVYDSAEMAEKDVMHDARSLKAQGDYEGAITAYRLAAVAEPTNRVPWMEIAKMQKDQLGDPAAAIGTLRHALESQSWEMDDAAFFLFRLADLYNEAAGDRDTAEAILAQVIDQFPETRHSANAGAKLREWSVAGETTPGSAIESSTIADEEAEYLERLRRADAANHAEEPERRA